MIHDPSRAPPRQRWRAKATTAANPTFTAVPLTAKIEPSTTNAGSLLGVAASMNCGRKARKNSATFGFSALVRKPCTNTRANGAAGRCDASA